MSLIDMTWQTVQLDNAIDKVTYTKKVPRKRFLNSGKFPIISQEQDFINGYWDNEKDVFHTKAPVVIFGDHTQVLKYVDFDFVLGADGVKILQPKPYLDSKYFYYALQQVDLKNLGYARHFRLLKEAEISYPESFDEQRWIAKKLDEVFEKVKVAKEAAEKNLQNAKELFESHLNNVFANPGKDWEEYKLHELSKNKNAIVSGPFGSNLKVSDYKDSGVPIFRLQNVGKGYFIDKDIKFISKEKAEELKYHSFLSGDLILAKLGIPIGKTCIVPESFKSGIIVADVVRIRPDKNLVDYDFLKYFLNTDISVRQLTGNISGATRPRVNLSDVRNIELYIPKLDEQRKIVKKLDALSVETKRLQKVYEKKFADLEELKKSILSKAFHAEL